MRRPKRSFCLKTHRSYTECGGKYSFRLYSKKNIISLLRNYNNDWKKILPKNGITECLIAKPGVYAIVIYDIKSKTKEVCYVGSSKNVGMRVSGHPIISFLRHKLDETFEFFLYVSYDNDYRELEKDVLREFRPFLNANIETANHFVYY